MDRTHAAHSRRSGYARLDKLAMVAIPSPVSESHSLSQAVSLSFFLSPPPPIPPIPRSVILSISPWLPSLTFSIALSPSHPTIPQVHDRPSAPHMTSRAQRVRTHALLRERAGAGVRGGTHVLRNGDEADADEREQRRPCRRSRASDGS